MDIWLARRLPSPPPMVWSPMFWRPQWLPQAQTTIATTDHQTTVGGWGSHTRARSTITREGEPATANHIQIHKASKSERGILAVLRLQEFKGSIFIFAPARGKTCNCQYKDTCIYICTCTDQYMHIYICVYIYTNIYTYIYILKRLPPLPPTFRTRCMDAWMLVLSLAW